MAQVKKFLDGREVVGTMRDGPHITVLLRPKQPGQRRTRRRLLLTEYLERVQRERPVPPARG